MDLEAALGMMMAREANPRTQQMQGQAVAQPSQQASPAGQRPAGPVTNPAAVGTAGRRVEASSARNDGAGRAWGGFQQPESASAPEAQARIGEAQRQALYSSDGPSPAAAAGEVTSGGRRPTNQDLINQYYRQGGGTWAGASKAARADGRTLSALLKDRGAIAQPASPSTSGASQASGAAQASGANQPSGATTSPTRRSDDTAGSSPGTRAPTTQRASATPSTSGGTAVSGAPLSGSAFGNQIAAAAERSARRLNSVGACALGVNNALISVGVPGRGHAYQKAEQLERNPRFREANVSANQLSQLPAGSVVVWGRSGAKLWGHVSVALGDGREASDHIARQMTGGRYGTDFGNGRDPEGRQFRVFLPN
ncbi:MAG: hypothetical protein FJ137_17920 [Deltaproteobacteria bacterium]|nr:hypothetical protein [Deltaproteobacteria bacterium]